MIKSKRNLKVQSHLSILSRVDFSWFSYFCKNKDTLSSQWKTLKTFVRNDVTKLKTTVMEKKRNTKLVMIHLIHKLCNSKLTGSSMFYWKLLFYGHQKYIKTKHFLKLWLPNNKQHENYYQTTLSLNDHQPLPSPLSSSSNSSSSSSSSSSGAVSVPWPSCSSWASWLSIIERVRESVRGGGCGGRSSASDGSSLLLSSTGSCLSGYSK